MQAYFIEQTWGHTHMLTPLISNSNSTFVTTILVTFLESRNINFNSTYQMYSHVIPLVRVWCLAPQSMHDVYVHALCSVVITRMHVGVALFL